MTAFHLARLVGISLDCPELPEQPDPHWRVLLDPAGHPFCLTPFTPDAVG